MMRVFICSKLRGDTREETISNIDRAITLGKQVWEEEGYVPIVPHLQALVMDDHEPDARDAGMLLSIDLLLHCQELRYYDNPTIGMATETAAAQKLGIPIKDYRYKPGGCFFQGFLCPECYADNGLDEDGPCPECGYQPEEEQPDPDRYRDELLEDWPDGLKRAVERVKWEERL